MSPVRNEENDSTNSNVRYLAYLSRFRTALSTATRYIAYTSDVGEAFRPIIPLGMVRAGYCISWVYVGSDVAYEGYKTKHAGKDNKMVTTAIVKFQSVASMLLPMLTIHTVVKYSAKTIFKDVKNAKIKL